MLSHIWLWGKSPEKQSMSLTIIRWKATDFKYDGTGQGWRERLVWEDISTPSQFHSVVASRWVVFGQGTWRAKIWALLLLEDLPGICIRLLLIEQSYAIMDSFGIFNTMGLTLSWRTCIFSFTGTSMWVHLAVIIGYDAYIILLNFFMVSTSMWGYAPNFDTSELSFPCIQVTLIHGWCRNLVVQKGEREGEWTNCIWWKYCLNIRSFHSSILEKLPQCRTLYIPPWCCWTQKHKTSVGHHFVVRWAESGGRCNARW